MFNRFYCLRSIFRLVIYTKFRMPKLKLVVIISAISTEFQLKSFKATWIRSNTRVHIHLRHWLWVTILIFRQMKTKPNLHWNRFSQYLMCTKFQPKSFKLLELTHAYTQNWLNWSLDRWDIKQIYNSTTTASHTHTKSYTRDWLLF